MQSSASSSILSKKKPTVSVEDVPEEDDTISGQPDSDQEEFAPGNDADYFVEEDEDGRFFGGGLTKEQKDILNIFEGAEGEPTGVSIYFVLSLCLAMSHANQATSCVLHCS